MIQQTRTLLKVWRLSHRLVNLKQPQILAVNDSVREPPHLPCAIDPSHLVLASLLMLPSDSQDPATTGRNSSPHGTFA